MHYKGGPPLTINLCTIKECKCDRNFWPFTTIALDGIPEFWQTVARKYDRTKDSFFLTLEMFVSIHSSCDLSFFVKSNQFLWYKSMVSNCWPGIGYNFSDKHIQSQERKIDFNGKREAAALMRFLTQQDSKNSGFQTCHSSQFRFVGLVICPPPLPPPFFGGPPFGFFLNTPHIVTITHKSHDWSSIRGK